MEARAKKGAIAAASAIAVWNGIGIISRIEYISKKLLWIWKLTTVDLNLAVNIVPTHSFHWLLDIPAKAYRNAQSIRLGSTGD